MPTPRTTIAILRSDTHADILRASIILENDDLGHFSLWNVLFPVLSLVMLLFLGMSEQTVNPLYAISQSSAADMPLSSVVSDLVAIRVSPPPVVKSVPMTFTDRVAMRRSKRVNEQPLHAAASSSSSSSRSIRARFDNVRGVYLTQNSVSRVQFLQETIDDLVAAGGTSIVFDVKGGNVYFHSAAPMANEKDLVLPFYDLPHILELAHSRGLYVIGRYIAAKDYGITEKLPDTRVKDPKTGRVLSANWIDPSDQTAIDYNMEIICELAASGIDEVNLDYIRFSTADVGALGVYSGKEKADRVEKFIQAARETVNRCGPTTRLGISTFAILGWAYDENVATLGQDVVRFAPLVDVISPMAYPATFAENAYYTPGKNPRSRMYHLVYRTILGYRDLLGPDGSKKLRPWIQGYNITRKNIDDEIAAVYDAGACGYQVWNASNAYSVTYAGMKGRTEIPEECRD